MGRNGKNRVHGGKDQDYDVKKYLLAEGRDSGTSCVRSFFKVSTVLEHLPTRCSVDVCVKLMGMRRGEGKVSRYVYVCGGGAYQVRQNPYKGPHPSGF
jgi:hypothetical protein